VIVGTVTGTVGRAWFEGRMWTVHSGGRLRSGGRYRVVARHGDVLEVITGA
jgi:membrane-bound ClpP family serine protease